MDYPYSVRLPGVAVTDPGTIVGRTIIDQYDLIAVKVLCQQRIDSLRQILFNLIDGHDDREKWICSHQSIGYNKFLRESPDYYLLKYPQVITHGGSDSIFLT